MSFIEKFFNNKFLSDFTFVTPKGEEFPGHRMVLSQFEYFRTAFTTSVGDKDKKEDALRLSIPCSEFYFTIIKQLYIKSSISMKDIPVEKFRSIYELERMINDNYTGELIQETIGARFQEFLNEDMDFVFNFSTSKPSEKEEYPFRSRIISKIVSDNIELDVSYFDTLIYRSLPQETQFRLCVDWDILEKYDITKTDSIPNKDIIKYLSLNHAQKSLFRQFSHLRCVYASLKPLKGFFYVPIGKIMDLDEGKKAFMLSPARDFNDNIIHLRIVGGPYNSYKIIKIEYENEKVDKMYIGNHYRVFVEGQMLLKDMEAYVVVDF